MSKQIGHSALASLILGAAMLAVITGSSPLADESSSFSRREITIKSSEHSQLRQLALTGKSTELIRKATLTIEKNAHDSDAFYFRAFGESDSKRKLDSALIDINRAVALHPEIGAYYALKAAVLHGLEEDEAAIEASDMARKLLPEDANVWNYRAAILSCLNQPGEAIKSVNVAIRLDGHNAQYHSTKARVLARLCRWNEAIEQLNEGLRLDPTNKIMHADRASIAVRVKQWGLAISDSTWLIAHNNGLLNRERDLHTRANSYVATKQYESALQDYRAAIKLFPDDRDLHADLCKLYEIVGEKQSADKERKWLRAFDQDTTPAQQ